MSDCKLRTILARAMSASSTRMPRRWAFGTRVRFSLCLRTRHVEPAPHANERPANDIGQAICVVSYNRLWLQFWLELLSPLSSLPCCFGFISSLTSSLISCSSCLHSRYRLFPALNSFLSSVVVSAVALVLASFAPSVLALFLRPALAPVALTYQIKPVQCVRLGTASSVRWTVGG